jgi:hypothetical protein
MKPVYQMMNARRKEQACHRNHHQTTIQRIQAGKKLPDGEPII